MTVAESLQQFGLPPSDEALPRIRELLAAEAEAERRGQPRAEDLALLCCVQLFSRAQPEDILRIWDAKCAGVELGAYLDAELLCGEGLDAAKGFLAASSDPAAAAALAHLVCREKVGHFDGFSPDRALRNYRRYFNLE
jgi:hypothetical protein